MKKRLIFLVLALAISFAGSAQLAQPVLAAGGVKSQVCQGIGEVISSGSSCATGGSSTKDINGIVTTVVNLLSVIVGIIAVIMLIYSGMRFVISGGDAQQVAAAKKGIMFAIVGLVLVGLAQIIVNFVLGNVIK